MMALDDQLVKLTKLIHPLVTKGPHGLWTQCSMLLTKGSTPLRDFFDFIYLLWFGFQIHVAEREKESLMSHHPKYELP